MRAYVFVDAEVEDARRIVSELREKAGVILADVVNGPHPVIACIEGDDPATVARTILFDIRKIPGVSDITVFLGMDGTDSSFDAGDIPEILPLTPDHKGRKRRKKEEGEIVDG